MVKETGRFERRKKILPGWRAGTESGFICNARKLHREGERSLRAVTQKGPA